VAFRQLGELFPAHCVITQLDEKTGSEKEITSFILMKQKWEYSVLIFVDAETLDYLGGDAGL